MHFLISSLTLLAYSDCVEGRWHLRHKVTMRVTQTPSTETISVGKMLSGKWDFPFSKTGCLELGSEQQPEEQERQELPQGLVCEKGSLSACERQNSVSRNPPLCPNSQPGAEGATVSYSPGPESTMVLSAALC